MSVNELKFLSAQNNTIKLNKMKNKLIISCLLIANFAYSQVAIGKTDISSPSVSLEFGSGNKGIVLPWVTAATAVTGAVPGTIIYDTADHKVKVKLANSWKDLTVDTSGATDTSLQDPLTDQLSARVCIGKNPQMDTTPGILVLTDNNMALVLPKVESPHLTIKNPAAGMMVYDTIAKQLAVFNGSKWSFWKP